MEDSKIIDLYWQRCESAISETALKYGTYCLKISMNILKNRNDGEECVNDTYMQTWNAIPPERPNCLSAYLARIVRNLSINRYRSLHAEKRAADRFALSLDELSECVPSGAVYSHNDVDSIGEAINEFLKTQSPDVRRIFVRRYFYCDAVSDIAERFQFTEGKIKSTLFRAREKLKLHLEKEGITV